MNETDVEIPSELRAHIEAEQLRPDKAVFSRSSWGIVRFGITPFLYITATIAIARWLTWHPLFIALLSFPFLLAAQRGFQTLVHDLSHKLYSSDIKINDVLGNYLAAGWTGASVPAYRDIHMQHHKYNGSKLDPEHISFSMIRERGGLLLHCMRYIFGLEALRLINKYYGNKQDDEATKVSPKKRHSKLHIFICQGVLLLVFWQVAQAPYLYALWLYMAVTWNPLLSNLRFLVEHPGESDLTVSTEGNWIERLYFAPFNFNYHLEHHLWPNLPPYRLAQAHDYLLHQGYFERHPEFLGSGFFSSLRGRK